MLANGTRRHLRQPSIDALLVKRVRAIRDLPHVVPTFEFLQADITRVFILLELSHGVLRVEGADHGTALDACGRGAPVPALREIVDIGAGELELVQQFGKRHLIRCFGGGSSLVDGVAREHLQYPPIELARAIQTRIPCHVLPLPRRPPSSVPNGHPSPLSARVARHCHGTSAPGRTRVAGRREREERTTPGIIVGGAGGSGSGSITTVVTLAIASLASILQALNTTDGRGSPPRYQCPHGATKECPNDTPSDSTADKF